MADARVEVGIEFVLPLFEDEIGGWRLMSRHINTWQEFDAPNPGGPSLACSQPHRLSNSRLEKKGR
jgi:hypothetical protein